MAVCGAEAQAPSPQPWALPHGVGRQVPPQSCSSDHRLGDQACLDRKLGKDLPRGHHSAAWMVEDWLWEQLRFLQSRCQRPTAVPGFLGDCREGRVAPNHDWSRQPRLSGTQTQN